MVRHRGGILCEDGLRDGSEESTSSERWEHSRKSSFPEPSGEHVRFQNCANEVLLFWYFIKAELGIRHELHATPHL